MNYSICSVLVILIFSTTFNQGKTITSNKRRTAGLVPYPRIGRYIATTRADGSAGLINFPRVGRSTASTSSSFNPDRICKLQCEWRSYVDQNIHFVISNDFRYDGHFKDTKESRNRYDDAKNSKGSRLSTCDKEEHGHLKRCNHYVNRPWAVFFAAQANFQ